MATWYKIMADWYESVIDRQIREAAVRRYVEALNERIRREQRGHLDGPPVVLSTVDVDEVVATWRATR